MWYVAKARLGTPLLEELLQKGWEPFAAIPLMDDAHVILRIHLNFVGEGEKAHLRAAA